ncbi:hypothetical protein Acsp03_23870 [Actinomadura sp. NBRC 104412]|uniref:hypothetical protein n=1 Tax=Actinomadura sp. NBRC 104412 TaxID=3032203 RepID=UPI0024A4DBE7|nr:hypothetical protein [Actinomadura sp. NBRC 104412]GLZ04921.1 hypothetical protein Acsp03_23870 [Actinomadura sp. NBRC 104412]
MAEDTRRTRIRDIEETLSVLRGELGERSDDPRDFGDSGQDLEAREEHETQIRALEDERRLLLEQLGEG